MAQTANHLNPVIHSGGLLRFDLTFLLNNPGIPRHYSAAELVADLAYGGRQ